MRRCCDCADCADCFVSDADTPCCRLSPDEKLVLRIERPSWSAPLALQVDPDCPNCGTGTDPSRLTGTRSYAAAEPLVVSYEHFSQMDTDQGGYCWFFDDGLFGRGAALPSNDYRYDLWNLWPPQCPQPAGGKPACCNISCGCSTPGTLLGPLNDDPTPTTGVCASNNPNLTTFQVEIIEDRPVDRPYQSYDTGTCPDGTNLSATAACDYAGYEWLKGIYNDGRNSTYTARGFHHYYWDGSDVQRLEQSGSALLQPLAWTLVGVFHREKWYKACEKNDGASSESCEQVPAWDCRVPEYQIYGCAGVPVFSWEIYEMYNANKITSDEYKDFFRAIDERKPMPAAVAKKLEESHFEHSGSTYGILQTKDWRDTTLPGESSPRSTETRLIRKDLVTYDSSGVRQVVANQFYNARKGGWTHVCRFTPEVACEGTDCAWSGQEIQQEAPQIRREVGCTASCENCNYQVWESPQGNQEARTNSCFTAAPLPQCTTCTNGTTCGPNCTVCEGCPTACGQGVLEGCGGTDGNGFCSQDTYSANCDSVHFTWTLITNDQTGDNDNEPCTFTNHAYLFVLNSACNANDASPFACSDGLCPPGPPTDTEDRPGYLATSRATKLRICNDLLVTDFCEGAIKTLKGTIDGGGTWYCKGGLARGVTSPDPTAEIPPNSATVAPYTDRGCGRYLCNNGRNFALGACCDPSGDCIDGVTEAQCAKCGAGSVWHGANSCCGINDDLC